VEPFDVDSFKKEMYFIIFIDDYPQYDYAYLWHEKYQIVNVFEIYLDETQRHLDKKVKVIRYDKGSEYYRMCDETRQYSNSFPKIL